MRYKLQSRSNCLVNQRISSTIIVVTKVGWRKLMLNIRVYVGPRVSLRKLAEPGGSALGQSSSGPPCFELKLTGDLKICLSNYVLLEDIISKT